MIVLIPLKLTNGEIKKSCPKMDVETHIFDPDGDVTLQLFRHPEKEESCSDDSGSPSWVPSPPPGLLDISLFRARHERADDEPVNQEPSELAAEPAAEDERTDRSSQDGNAVTSVAENIDEVEEDEAYPLGQPVHMIVSSKHLILVSHYFKAMLHSKDGKFEEAKILRSESKITISLPRQRSRRLYRPSEHDTWIYEEGATKSQLRILDQDHNPGREASDAGSN